MDQKTDAGEVFNAKDFESIQLRISFKNLTTRTETKSTDQVSLIEIGDRTLYLELPERSCNVKHSVMVDISQIEKGLKTLKPLLSVTGKISQVEDVGEHLNQVSIHCLQFDEESWKKLVNIYAARQEEINQFLATVRG